MEAEGLTDKLRSQEIMICLQTPLLFFCKKYIPHPMARLVLSAVIRKLVFMHRRTVR